MPPPDTNADFVRWEFGLSLPSGSKVPDPMVVLDCPSEFPRIDGRFMTTEYEWVWLDVFVPERTEGGKNIFHRLNGLAMHSNKTGETKWFYAGDHSLIQEHVFIPRSKDAPEGDGYIIAMIERTAVSRCDLVFIDTKELEKPIAIVQLPFHLKSQVHGNWVDAVALGWTNPLVRQIADSKFSQLGSLVPLP